MKESTAAYFYKKLLRDNKYIFPIFYVFIVLLYATVSLQSYGYDDEFFNINLIEKFGFKTINYLQHSDVHPPVSYIINVSLFSLFNDWAVVRLASGLLTSFALIFVINNELKVFGNRQALIVFLLLALNPAILMWCTGIRWYAYFMPVLFYLVFQPVHRGYKAWIIALAGITLLSYIGYIAFLIFVPILLLYWALSDEPVKNKLKYILYLSPVFWALYAYQLYFFLTVHVKSKKKEEYGLMEDLRGYFISQVSNQGVFPLSVPAILSLAGFLGILFCIIRYSLKNTNKRSSNIILIAYLLATILLFVSGVAGKFRNLIVLIPFQIFLILHYYAILKNSRLYLCSVALISIANIYGCVNVFCHTDTTKNSWNLPVRDLISDINRVHKNDTSVLLFTHDPTLTSVLQNNKFNVVSLYNNNSTNNFQNVGTAIFINTFRGSLNKRFYDSLILEETNIPNSKKEVINIGPDKFYNWKKKIITDYPEYQVEIMILQNPQNLQDLIFWNKKRFIFRKAGTTTF
jgi:hypothetical protein